MTEMPPGWKPKSETGDAMRKGLSPDALKKTVTRDEMFDLVGMLADNNKKLFARVKELENRPTLKYLGVWSAEKVYGTQSFVTDAGSMWASQRASVGERPGTGSDGGYWQSKKERTRDDLR
jgi:hypothetical protein